MEVVLIKSANKNKKFDVNIDGKKISFGAAGYEDFTTHKDPKRKELYITRHAKRKDWDKSEVKTAGYWSKHLLWNKDTLRKSMDDISRKHNLNIKIK